MGRGIKLPHLVLATAMALYFAALTNAQNLAIGAHASTLGVGGDVAVKVAEWANVRGSFNFYQYERGLIKDGIHYKGNVNLRSGAAYLDWFPFRNGFHLSPGLVFYNGNEADMDAAVPAGQTFTLGGTTYTNTVGALPITGHGSIVFPAVAPEVRVGWGNLIAKGERHIGFNVEVGAVFQGTPTASLHLQGTACDPTGRICVDASNPIFQSSIQAEVAKINNSISSFKVYPVLSTGFAYRF